MRIIQINYLKIKQLMKQKNLSQNQLAIKANVTKGTISRIINGKRGAGKKVVTGLLKTFPDETVESLFKEKGSKPI